MKIQTLALATVLAITSTATFAKGDGYNKSHEARMRFRENQEKIHGKKQQAEPQLKTSKANAKPQTEDK
ncbi:MULTISPECIES: hypothetical protein [Pseudomonas]|uniref:hypothetical protein n=1 Tax=Pseudomonas TaxID=286 RepID=UPI001C80C3A5|nr:MULTISPECIES: hypothetical protein [Pseudomonas]MDH0897590.1 hypothetical protein [Pseudomonas sp. GD03875]MDH1067638.1 hypothetical protein [Pseudomonas sp. GD03985]